MGARSTTKIYQDGKFVMAVYKQHRGYPETWGRDLKEFLKSKKFLARKSDGKDLYGCQEGVV